MAQDLIRVSIIEDYFLSRVAIQAALEQYKQIQFIAEAETGEEGLRQLEVNQPDVLLLDIGLPDQDGLSVARTVVEKWPGVKVIMFTSHETPEEVEKAFNIGVSAYVYKHVAPAQLVRVIETVMFGTLPSDLEMDQVVKYANKAAQ